MSETIGTACCGSQHASKYCPDCGRKLIADRPLEGLMKHVRTQCLKMASLKKYGHSPRPEIVAKWEAWRDALKQLLADRNANG